MHAVKGRHRPSRSPHPPDKSRTGREVGLRESSSGAVCCPAARARLAPRFPPLLAAPRLAPAPGVDFLGPAGCGRGCTPGSRRWIR